MRSTGVTGSEERSSEVRDSVALKSLELNEMSGDTGSQTRESIVKELVTMAAMTITPDTVIELMMWNLARTVTWVADLVGYREGVRMAVIEVMQELSLGWENTLRVMTKLVNRRLSMMRIQAHTGRNAATRPMETARYLRMF